MVQKEVKRKTTTYGLIGILLAVLLVAMIYSYGVSPGNSPLPFPNVSTTPNSQSSQPSNEITPSPGTAAPTPFGTSGVPGTPLPGTSAGTSPEATPVPVSSPAPETSPMKTFGSMDELTSFINASSRGASPTYSVSPAQPGALTGAATGTNAAVPAPVPNTAIAQAPASTSGTGAQNTQDHSTTNIQVAGVDEADTVKTDGKYLYAIGNNSQVVYIIDPNPNSAKVLSKIWVNNTYLSGIYLSQDGSKLAVLGNQYQFVPYLYFGKTSASSAYYPIPLPPYWNSGTSFVMVYDVSNKANPVLTRNFTITGNYVNSRLIGDYIYDIVNEGAWLTDGTAVLPAVFNGPNAYSISPTQIYYANTSDTYYTFTTIVSINIMDAASATANKTIMMGGAGNIYVSQTNIYITYPVWNYQPVPLNTPSPVSAPSVASSGGAASSGAGVATGIAIMPIMIRPSWEGTAIYRIQVYKDSMSFVAQGNVTGSVMSQYSMDENGAYFRIATTSYDYSNAEYWLMVPQNNLYVLDMNLKLVGKLENLATGETLHAARFMGSRCYLVTFNTVDPLFVIDLTTPTAPSVLGNLTIPGYSDFLQPYDATHLIGIGQNVNASIDADKIHTPGAVYYTAILGLKVSLFDVSDVNNPKEVSKVIIGDRGTTSAALNDPKALLFDKSRNLLVLPVNLYENITSNPSPSPTPLAPTKTGVATPVLPPIWDYGPQFVWQGAYVFSIDLTSGIQLRGNVTQLDNAAAILANPALLYTSSYQWLNYNQFINREVYIGNVLYTLSDSRVQLNALDTLALIARVELN